MIPWLTEHGPSLVAVLAAITAMMRSRARKDAASAEAIEALTEAHRSCEERVAVLTGTVETLTERVEATEIRATTAETAAQALDAELRRLMQEIQR